MDNPFLPLIVIAVCILLFLAFREIVMWYWKINKIIEHQETQSQILTKILIRLEEREEN